MNLLELEDIKKNFRIVKIENNNAYLKLHRGRYIIKVAIPFKTDEKLASLFGHILGDGCIKSKEGNIYYTNKSKDLIDEFKAIIEELFGIEPKTNFNQKRRFYEVYPPKTIARFLVLCGFPKGPKTEQIITIPSWIKEGSKEVKASFVRALFDDEGTVINSKRNFVISFGMNKQKLLLESHKVFMKDIRQILISLEIFPNEVFERKQPKEATQLGFHIYKRYNLIKFLQNVGFTDNKKQQKLITAINSYKTYGRYETKMRILDALKTKGKLRTKDLSLIVNRDRKVIWKNLHKLSQEGLLKKILVSKKGTIERVFWELNNLNS